MAKITHKLVLAWVDMDGFEMTGRYKDRLNQYPETRAIPQAKATCWGDDTPEYRARLIDHVKKEASDHLWIGWFLLPYDDTILMQARAKALQSYQRK